MVTISPAVVGLLVGLSVQAEEIAMAAYWWE
jgi:hypothetical protein